MSDTDLTPRRRAALKAVALAGGAEGAKAKRILANADAKPAVDLANLPKSLAEAKGDAKAFSRADMARQAAATTGEAVPGSAGASASRKSMLAELKRQGLEPAR